MFRFLPFCLENGKGKIEGKEVEKKTKEVCFDGMFKDGFIDLN